MKYANRLRCMMPQSLRSYMLLVCMALATPLVHALDHPEARDYVAEFERRAQPFEKHLLDQSRVSGAAQAGAAYAKFLDKELNQAYQSLLKKIADPKAREQLKKSQRAWLAYYKAESDFIATNWVPDNFGTSYALSRELYWTSLTENRIEVLLSYLGNY